MFLQQHFAVAAQGEAEEQQSGVAPVIMALFWGELKGFCLCLLHGNSSSWK